MGPSRRILSKPKVSSRVLPVGLRDSRLQPSHREKRQHIEPSVVVIHNNVRAFRRHRDVIPMRDGKFPAISHPQFEWNSTRRGRLNLLPGHTNSLVHRANSGKPPYAGSPDITVTTGLSAGRPCFFHAPALPGKVCFLFLRVWISLKLTRITNDNGTHTSTADHRSAGVALALECRCGG